MNVLEVFGLLRCYATLSGSYRRFGTGLSRNVGTGFSRNFGNKSALCNISGERRPHLHLGGSPKSRVNLRYRVHSKLPYPYPESDQSSPKFSHLLSSRYLFNVTLQCMRRSSNWSALLIFFGHTHRMHFSSSPYVAHRIPGFITIVIFDETYKLLVFIMQLLLVSCYFLPFRPKYPPQHPILVHPQPVFLPQCERPSFTPIQNKGKNYSLVYFNLYVF